MTTAPNPSIPLSRSVEKNGEGNSAPQNPAVDSGRTMVALAAGAATAMAGILFFVLLRHGWILDSAGRPSTVDFIAFWTTGKLALAGKAALAYDPDILHRAQIAAAHHWFPGYFFWNYPPFFIFVAAALAMLPYEISFLCWMLVTLAAYAGAVGTIGRRWDAALFACASPVVLLNAYVGQTGFLSAALLGGCLLLLKRSPAMAGVLLALLAYKPQFGILLPLVLVVSGSWRTLLWATATIVTIGVASELAFGNGAYAGFFHLLPVLSRSTLTLGEEGWTKLQSIYSLVRFAGDGNSAAWAVQIAVLLSCAIAQIALWRSEQPFELKAAALTVCVMLCTPYMHVYDFPVLVVAIAFLYAHRPLDRLEWAIVISANLLLLAFLAQLAPIGPGIVLLVGALVLRRISQSLQSPSSHKPFWLFA